MERKRLRNTDNSRNRKRIRKNYYRKGRTHDFRKKQAKRRKGKDHVTQTTAETVR